MSYDNWLTTDELQDIIEYVEACHPLWNALVSMDTSISAELSSNLELDLYDTDAQLVGHIRFAEDGPAFFYPQPE